MLQAKCIQKFRDKNNHIYGYRLQDQQGNTKDVTPDQLKTAIRNKQIEITNLTLTSDDRLIDAASDEQEHTKNSQATQVNSKTTLEKYQSIKNRAKMLGLEIKQKSYTRCSLEIITLKDISIIYISEDSFRINDQRDNGDIYELFAETVQKLGTNIKIIGGKGLRSTKYMFYNCKGQTIDLTDFEINDNTDIKLMFQKCESKIITNNKRILDEYNNGQTFHNFDMSKIEDAILGFRRALAYRKRNAEWDNLLIQIEDNHTIAFYVPSTHRIHYYGESNPRMVSIDLSQFITDEYSSYNIHGEFYTKKTKSQCKSYKEGKASLPLWGGTNFDYCRSGDWNEDLLNEFYYKYNKRNPEDVFEDIIEYTIKKNGE